MNKSEAMRLFADEVPGYVAPKDVTCGFCQMAIRHRWNTFVVTRVADGRLPGRAINWANPWS